MLLDPVAATAKGEVPRWRVKCDWKGCNRIFLSGHKTGLHYCPDEHQKANKKAITKDACRRWREVGKVAGTELDRRKYRTTANVNTYSAWVDIAPKCPVCGEPISAMKDCKCPPDVPDPVW